ncbi:MAG: hypothetical protein ACE5JN_02035 [Candidatus Methylomirabilia bacterium]
MIETLIETILAFSLAILIASGGLLLRRLWSERERPSYRRSPGDEAVFRA